MENNFLISVVVPVKNGEQYLEKCINSILCQSYQNLDVIIVNDGSIDNTYSICEKFASLDNRITVVHSEVNKGVSHSRNIGINLAKGQWISFIDADDWVEDGIYDKIVKSDLKNVDVVFWRFTKDYPNGEIKKYNETTIRLLADKPYNIQYTLKQTFIEEQQDEIVTDYVFSGVCRTLFKKEIIVDNNLRFDECLRYAEDKLFLVDYFSFCRNGLLIDEYLYHYRQNVDKSATSTIINETYSLKWLKTFLPNIEKAIVNNSHISNKTKRELVFYMKDRFVFRAIMFNQKRDYRLMLKDSYIRNIIKSWNKENLMQSGLNKRDVRYRMAVKYKIMWAIKILRLINRIIKVK